MWITTTDLEAVLKHPIPANRAGWAALCVDAADAYASTLEYSRQAYLASDPAFTLGVAMLAAEMFNTGAAGSAAMEWDGNTAPPPVSAVLTTGIRSLLRIGGYGTGIVA